MVPLYLVEELIDLTEEIKGCADWSFEFNLLSMKLGDKISEIRGEQVEPFDLSLTLGDFGVGTKVRMVDVTGLFYKHNVEVGSVLEVVETVEDGGRYDHFVARFHGYEHSGWYEFMVFDQGRFELVE